MVEEAGIPTLTMTSALDITRAVKPPRAVFVNFPLGHETGKPDDPANQRAIVRDALSAFETIQYPGAIVELPYVWDPNDSSWEETDYTDHGFKPQRPKKEEVQRIEARRQAKYAGSASLVRE